MQALPRCGGAAASAAAGSLCRGSGMCCLADARITELRPCALQADLLKYDHILLAIMDSNPVLSSASRTALLTAAQLATQNASKL